MLCLGIEKLKNRFVRVTIFSLFMGPLSVGLASSNLVFSSDSQRHRLCAANFTEISNEQLRPAFKAALEQINSEVLGSDELIRKLMIALLVDSHVLLEGPVGTGKTQAAKSMAQSLGLTNYRVQFVADTSPRDILGSLETMNDKSQRLIESALPYNIVLADEINRAPSRVQSALLQAMGEKTFTMKGMQFDLPKVFMVIATQNPKDSIGTYPITEAQADRFIFKININYPDQETELAILKLQLKKQMQKLIGHSGTENLENTKLDETRVLAARKNVLDVNLSKEAEDYIIKIVMNSRSNKSLEQGLSPRASLALAMAAKANAWLDAKEIADVKDVKFVLRDILSHRLNLTDEASINDESIDNIIKIISE